MRYADLWWQLLNAELDAGARAALSGRLAALLGPHAPRLGDGELRALRPTLRAARALWVEAGRQPAALLRARLLETAGALDGGLLDALLAPGSVRGPLRPVELQRLLQRALVHGALAYLLEHELVAGAGLQRCIGLAVVDGSATWEALDSFAWQADPALVRAQLGALPEAPLARCGMLFVPNGRGGYCSRRCRDRSFALARRQRQPSYDADKQRRYRQRRRGERVVTTGSPP